MKHSDLIKIGLYAVVAALLSTMVIGFVYAVTRPHQPNGMTKQVTITYTYIPEYDQTRKDK